jgi:hypothetical protein
MASIGASASTLITCGCKARAFFLFPGHGFRLSSNPLHKQSSPYRKVVECGADSPKRSSAGRSGNKNSALDSTAKAARVNPISQEFVKAEENLLPKLLSSNQEQQPSKRSNQEDKKKKLQTLRQALMQQLKLDKAIDELVSFMAPREKGDIRDVILMSLSFAVLVYISQRLVCAYCTLRHMMPHNF